MKQQQFTPEQIKHWRQYERVRVSGRFNMITDARAAWQTAGLGRAEYLFVLENYEELERLARK